MDTNANTSEEVQAESTPGEEGRPEWLPEKFRDAEQMATAYTELEKMLGKQTAQEPQGSEEPTSSQPTDTPGSLEIPEAPESDVYQEFSQLYTEQKGELTAEQITQFSEKSGVPQEMVQTYIAGLDAQTQRTVGTVMEAAGGQETYQAAVQWAQGAMSAQEIQAFNAVMNSGDTAQATLAAKGLVAQYQAANGTNPQLVSGLTQGSTGSQAFTSQAEMIRAISDKKYSEDPAYREEVQRRIAMSDF